MSKSPDKSAGNSRLVSAGILDTWLEHGIFPDRLLDQVTSDRAFIMDLVYGVIRNRRALEWMASRLAQRGVSPAVLPFLMVGLHQVLFMAKVEDFAAVHETVEAAKIRLGPRPAGMVNAVLRNAQRQRTALLEELARQPDAVRLSHPDVLVDRWTRQFGREAALRLCGWNNTPAHITLRLNRIKVSLPDYLIALAQAGITGVEPHPFRPHDFLQLPHGLRVADLPGYAAGWFMIQDPATVLAPEGLAPQPEERVLDACAAPGGKTTVLAERMAGRGTLVAVDRDPQRLSMLRDTLARTGWSFVHVAQADLTKPDKYPVGHPLHTAASFDRILADVPCTNTGVLRRRPDARWRFSLENLKEMTRTQTALLDGCSRYLKPGGSLVYSTCSLEPEEDEDLLACWLERRPDWTLVRSQKVLPFETQTDGAFVALLRKAVS